MPVITFKTMFKIFQIFLYCFVLIQQTHGQLKKCPLSPSIHSTPSEVFDTANALLVATTDTNRSLGSSRRRKNEVHEINEIVLKVVANNLPHTLQIEVNTSTDQPFRIHLTDQHQKVYFNQYYPNTQKVNVRIYFKYASKTTQYYLQVISPVQRIQKRIVSTQPFENK